MSNDFILVEQTSTYDLAFLEGLSSVRECVSYCILEHLGPRDKSTAHLGKFKRQRSDSSVG